jgi:putative membrane protein
MENAIDHQKVDMPRHIIPICLGLSAMAALFLFWLIYGREASTGYDVSYLGAVNASLNFASATCLFAGLAAIRKGNWKLHRNFMLAALLLSALFLVSYIIYHTFHGDSRFLGQGIIRPIYFFILISHIVLSVVALPLILITASLSLTRRFSHHKKWAKWTFPIWAYVAVTGVSVFLLLKSFGSA